MELSTDCCLVLHVNYNLSLGKRLLRAEASTGVRDRGLDRLDMYMWESVEHAKVKDMSRRHGSRLLGAWLTDRLVVAGLADTGVFGGRLSRSPSSLCEAEIGPSLADKSTVTVG